MQIKSADFVTSAAKAAQFLKRPIPHFVFAGRSNVGKSSILNKILKRKALAKTSSTPGKTRLINYFLINDNMFFVDIPGYGYARVSREESAKWGELIETYLTETPYIALVFQLIDIRHEPTAQDLQMIEWLRHANLPFRILLTKGDKLSRNKVQAQRAAISRLLQVDKNDLIATSAVSGLGIDEIRTEIEQAYQISKTAIAAQ